MIKKPKHQETIPVRLNLSNLIQPQINQSGIDTTPKKEEPKKPKSPLNLYRRYCDTQTLRNTLPLSLRTKENNINDLS